MIDYRFYSRWGIAGDLCKAERTLFGFRSPFSDIRLEWCCIHVESQLYLTTPSVADGDIRHGHDLLLDPASSALFRLQLTPRLGITYESLRQEEYDNVSGQCGGA